MGKPIDKLDFWKERIDTAVKPHYSVYVVHEEGWKKILNEHLLIIQNNIGAGSKVLDAGCGYGRMSEYFPNYTGIDFSPDFIEKAKKNYPDKDFRVMNLKNIEFADNEFDWVICVSIKKMIIDNLGIDEWNKMEAELKRVAKKVLILEYETPNEYKII